MCVCVCVCLYVHTHTSLNLKTLWHRCYYYFSFVNENSKAQRKFWGNVLLLVNGWARTGAEALCCAPSPRDTCETHPIILEAKAHIIRKQKH